MNKSQIIPGYTKLYREELYISKQHPELVIAPPPIAQFRLKERTIALTQFKPLRDWYKKPIYVTSGHCTANLNSLIRPNHADSEHLWYDNTAAWDFVPRNPDDLKYCFEWMANNLRDYVGQLIFEGDHVHVSLPTLSHWREVREL
jgi:hypothetical protein